MKRKRIFLFISIIVIVIITINYSVTEQTQSSKNDHSSEKAALISENFKAKVINEKQEYSDKVISSLKEKESQYVALCQDLKKKYFSDDDEMIDPTAATYNDVNYIEDNIKMMRYIAHKIANYGPETVSLCLIDEYYNYMRTLMDALKNKKIGPKQKRSIARFIIESADEFKNKDVLLSLSLVRELIDRNFLSTDFLYESKDYMTKFKNNEDDYALGKIEELNYKTEKSKLIDDVSSLLLSIQRSQQ